MGGSPLATLKIKEEYDAVFYLRPIRPHISVDRFHAT